MLAIVMVMVMMLDGSVVVVTVGWWCDGSDGVDASGDGNCARHGDSDSEGDGDIVMVMVSHTCCTFAPLSTVCLMRSMAALCEMVFRLILSLYVHS